MLERSVARWIRTDAAAVFIFALWAVAATHSWMWFLILFLAPELSMVGYVLGPRAGAVTYNSCHVYACPAGLLAASLTYHLPFGTAAALSWIAHIAFDNVVGYGLKLPNGFEHTVYGPIESKRAESRYQGRGRLAFRLVNETTHIPDNCLSALCQNCVTYPPEPLVKSVTYGDAPTRIGVAELVDSELRWWDLVCVSTRERKQFPSVLFQPLGHLSLRLASLAQGRPL